MHWSQEPFDIRGTRDIVSDAPDDFKRAAVEANSIKCVPRPQQSALRQRNCSKKVMKKLVAKFSHLLPTDDRLGHQPRNQSLTNSASELVETERPCGILKIEL